MWSIIVYIALIVIVIATVAALIAVTGETEWFYLLAIIIIPAMGLIAACTYDTEDELMAKYERAKTHAGYIESGMVSDQDDLYEFVSEAAHMNELIKLHREKAGNRWNGFMYFESIGNLEPVTIHIAQGQDTSNQ